jgi:pimeloyl-ACP methyl ester carboxylesterase
LYPSFFLVIEQRTQMTEGLMFIHGLEGSSQGVKARLLREIFPEMLIPDFRGSLDDRMEILYKIIRDQDGWTLVGSSFGGLMAALAACEKPAQFAKLVLLAPALIWPDFMGASWPPIQVPVVIYHGADDEIIPLKKVQDISQRVFLNLEFNVVQDDHGLYRTVHNLDWKKLLVYP